MRAAQMATSEQLAAASAVTAAYVQRQRLLSMLVSRDVLRVLRTAFNLRDPGASWPLVRALLAGVIREHRRQAAANAARYYRDVRATVLRGAPVPRGQVADPFARPAQVDDDLAAIARDIRRQVEAETARELAEDRAVRAREAITPVEPDEVDEERMDANLNATGIATYRRSLRSGRSPEAARDAMGVTLSGTASRLVQEAARQVVRDASEADPQAIGWARISDGDPCSWCAMLISRGAVYKSAESAGLRQADRFEGESPFRWHDHCGCQVIPIFDSNDPHLQRAEELYEQWLRETAGTSGAGARNAWRRYWESRHPQAG
jgi:hypothetical protein